MSDAADTMPELPDDIGALKSIIGEKLTIIGAQTTHVREMEFRIAVLGNCSPPGLRVGPVELGEEGFDTRIAG